MIGIIHRIFFTNIGKLKQSLFKVILIVDSESGIGIVPEIST